MDEAVLRIVLQEDSGRRTGPAITPSTSAGSTPASTPPSAPVYSSSEGFDPTVEVQRRREAERRRSLVNAAYNNQYGNQIGGAAAGGLDSVLNSISMIRGTIGGMFGPIIGSILDVVIGFRRAQTQNPKDDYEAKLLEEARRATEATKLVEKAVWGAAKQTPTGQQTQAAAAASTPGATPPNTTTPPVGTSPGSTAIAAGMPPGTGIASQPPVGIGFAQGRGWSPGTMRQGFPNFQPNIPQAPPPIPTMGQQLMSAAPYVGIALAIDQAVKGAVKGIMGGAGNFMIGAASTGEDASKTIQQLSTAVGKFGDMLPGIGLAFTIVGEAGKILGGLMQEFSRTAERFAEYNPQIQQSLALAEIRRVMGDMRRAQESGSELARFVEEQSRVQQQFEEIKMRIWMKLLPIVTAILEVLGEFLGVVTDMRDQNAQVADPTTMLEAGLIRMPEF